MNLLEFVKTKLILIWQRYRIIEVDIDHVNYTSTQFKSKEIFKIINIKNIAAEYRNRKGYVYEETLLFNGYGI
jgi:hypothetical protein